MATTSNRRSWMIVSIASICSGTNGRPKCRSETWNTVTIGRPAASSEASDDGVGELRRGRGPAEIARDGLSLADHTLHRVANAARARVIAEMLEHEARRVHERAGVRDALSRDVGRGTVNGLEDGGVRSEVRARCESESADQTRDQV